MLFIFAARKSYMTACCVKMPCRIFKVDKFCGGIVGGQLRTFVKSLLHGNHIKAGKGENVIYFIVK